MTAQTTRAVQGDPSEDLAAIHLSSLPAMTPKRLRSLLHQHRPSQALAAIRSWNSIDRHSTGPLDALFASRSTHSEGRPLGEIWKEAIIRAETSCDHAQETSDRRPQSVTVLGDTRYPRRLAVDPEAPAVLFSIGDLDALEQPRVGIIGTRHATAHGRRCAHRFGEVLTAHGVGVVSGLARGIDVNAHRGALDHVRNDLGCESMATRTIRSGRPIGVVASGLDVVYPREHVSEWHEVGDRGLLLSESPPGTEPHAFRFPLRNRILAALCDVLVVVESRTTGGSMITVRAALERGVTVMAVPGSTSTRSAEGTNQLIRDGASIAVEPEDVLAVLGLEAHRRSTHFDPRPHPSTADAELLELMGVEPMTLDHVVSRTHRDLVDVALALGRLENQGWLMSTAGWFERIEFREVFDPLR